MQSLQIMIESIRVFNTRKYRRRTYNLVSINNRFELLYLITFRYYILASDYTDTSEISLAS